MRHFEKVRFACDSLVALGNSTADGNVLFAKNSDRPAFESQPLVQLARARHASGARVQCTYIDIDQVAETFRVIGSQPYWCWGFEHGLNEHGVAIGNHTVFTKDPLEGKGLLGMDLVRLGLERAATAAAAVEVVTTLLQQYGQGGSGYNDKDWPYHNSFLVADRNAAFVVESSDRRWAVRQVTSVGSVSNHLSIGSDWDAVSADAKEHAIAAGWWSRDDTARFDFAAAYRDTSMAPEVVSSGRYRRTCDLLARDKGKVSVHSLKAALRDHYGNIAPHGDDSPADEGYFSVCMHADPVGTTTASMIARLPSDPGASLVYWASLGSPCVSAFVPLFVDGDIPSVLSRGGAEVSDDSPWWQLKQLLQLVERDWNRHAPGVRGALDRFEADCADDMQRASGAGTPAARTTYMDGAVRKLLEVVEQLRRELQ